MWNQSSDIFYQSRLVTWTSLLLLKPAAHWSGSGLIVSPWAKKNQNIQSAELSTWRDIHSVSPRQRVTNCVA